MSNESARTPLAAATAGIRRLVLANQGRDNGEGCGVCLECETPNSWCQCEQMARAALSGLFDAYYDVRESR